MHPTCSSANMIEMHSYLYSARRIPSHIVIPVGITSISKCNAKNLETFEASTNTPSKQICHIDPCIVSWNFPKLPKASSKFQVIEQQAPWGNRDSASDNGFGVGTRWEVTCILEFHPSSDMHVKNDTSNNGLQVLTICLLMDAHLNHSREGSF